MLMTGCSFLLSPTAGEKLIINCFAVLCAILYLLYFANTLPFNRNEVPIIGKLFPLLNSYVHKLHQHVQLLFVFQSLSTAILRHQWALPFYSTWFALAWQEKENTAVLQSFSKTSLPDIWAGYFVQAIMLIRYVRHVF